MPPNSKTEAGAYLRDKMAAAGETQSSLAASVGTSRVFVNQVVNGKYRAGAEWLDLVASALKLSAEERVEFHRAAAKDHGFKIDLS